MVNENELGPLVDDGVVYDSNGDKVGKVAQVFVDDTSGEPKWVSVNTGLFGSNENFVPLHGARVTGNEVHVGFTKNMVKDAPNVDADHHLSREEESQLFAHYGLSNDSPTTEAPQTDHHRDQAPTTGQQPVDDQGFMEPPADAVAAGADHGAAGLHGGPHPDAQGAGQDVSGPTTDEAMTRSEERLNVHTEQHEAGRARLRKYVVTENVTTTVPVQREEVRVEREPITEANREQATTGADLSEEEHEVTLNEERVVVDKETVPVERVRLDKDVVTDEQQVSEDVRKEQIDADLPTTGHGQHAGPEATGEHPDTSR